MKDLAITQEYFICAVNSKGKISSFSTEKLVCLIASGLLELKMENCIQLDKKSVVVTHSLPKTKAYLKPLYDFIDKPKPVRLEKILEAYIYSINDKVLYTLINAIGYSLKDLDLVEVTHSDKTAYIPNARAVHYVIDMIRSEFLEEGEVTDDIATLLILLGKSKLLKTYFSDYEQKEIKTKLKTLTHSDTGQMIKETVAYVDNMITMISVLILAYS